MKRTPFVAGNWKMHGTKQQVYELVTCITEKISACKSNIDIVLCPPVIYIPYVNSLINSHNLQIGAQNVCYAAQGAFTGEISVAMLQDFSCKYVIIGHSERRKLFAETDDQLAKKFKLAYDCGLTPILCLGETKQEWENSLTFEVVARQLNYVVGAVGIECFSQAIIAYEPVWAIGTGMTATPEHAEQVHAHLREIISKQDSTLAKQIKIIYGGSVKVENATSLFSCANIDGGLIGGASLKAEEFSEICFKAVAVAE